MTTLLDPTKFPPPLPAGSFEGTPGATTRLVRHTTPSTGPIGASTVDHPMGRPVAARTASAAPARYDVEIVVPVYNEERDLVPSVTRLRAFLDRDFPFTTLITIADNASTDNTWSDAQWLSVVLDDVRAVHLAAKGRGRALSQTWSAADARVVAYMDVDLSTDLAALLPLVAPLLSGHSDVAIGSRLARSARVTRGVKRELISRCYNLLLKATLGLHIRDAQCGFKAIRSDVAQALLPYVHDTGWFFDTELLAVAERAGLRIAEVPVDWVDDPDSRVDIVATAWGDARGIVRLWGEFLHRRIPLAALRVTLGRANGSVLPGLLGQMTRFGAIGVASTLAYLCVYLGLRPLMGAQVANLVALLLTAVANTAANRRFTFGVTGRHAGRHQLEGLLVFGVGLALTSGVLALLSLVDANPPRLFEVTCLVLANLTATAVRFLAMRLWIFRPQKGSK